MTKTILVADDSKTMQKIVELTFRTTQFTVVKASSADEALMKIPRSKPDVILADTQMPGKDGYQLCADLKRDPATANIPVVLLLGNLENLDEARAREVRATGHIKKPFDTQSLINQVTEIAGLGASSAVSTPMSFAASLAARQGGHVEPAPTPAPATPMPAPTAPRPVTPSPMAASRPIAQPNPPAPATPLQGSTFGNLFPAPSSASPVGAISGRAESPSWPAPPPRSPEASRPPVTASGRPIVAAPDEDALKAPMLEPPRRPSPEDMAHAAKVDMWSMADPVSDDIAVDEPSESDLAPTRTHQLPSSRPMLHAAEEVAERAAPEIESAAAASPAMSKDDLMRMAREVIERVVWEVVPDLAETIIREEIRRLTRPEA